MRHVFPTSEVPHLWAHQIQQDARNPQGNLYFRGATIYSYRESWPLARIYDNPKGKRRGDSPAELVLTNSERYGVTTTMHQSEVNRAASHLPCIAVPCVTPNYGADISAHDHAENLEYFAKQIAEHLAKAKRALAVSNVRWRAEAAGALDNDAERYSKFFGIRRKPAAYPAAEFTEALLRAQRIEMPDPVRDAAKIRARERKAAAKHARLNALVETYSRTWRTGEYGNRPQDINRSDWQAIKYSAGIMLRVSGDQIESSLGARIPLEHAPRIWTLVQACRSSGRAYKRNGHTEHAGQYAIDSVSAEGELKAGCHTIPYAELELLARTLGLPC